MKRKTIHTMCISLSFRPKTSQCGKFWVPLCARTSMWNSLDRPSMSGRSYLSDYVTWHNVKTTSVCLLTQITKCTRTISRKGMMHVFFLYFFQSIFIFIKCHFFKCVSKTHLAVCSFQDKVEIRQWSWLELLEGMLKASLRALLVVRRTVQVIKFWGFR